jgi:hypothetical protein
LGWNQAVIAADQRAYQEPLRKNCSAMKVTLAIEVETSRLMRATPAKPRASPRMMIGSGIRTSQPRGTKRPTSIGPRTRRTVLMIRAAVVSQRRTCARITAVAP